MWRWRQQVLHWPSDFSLLLSHRQWLCHFSSGSHRNSGHSIHLCFTRSSVFKPREASSAGFRDVGMYLHCSTYDLYLMVVTLFSTKVWNLLSSLLMYLRTDVLSVQKQVFFSGSWSSEWSISSTCTATMAAVSSKRGMVTGFKGATVALPKRRAT